MICRKIEVDLQRATASQRQLPAERTNVATDDCNRCTFRPEESSTRLSDMESNSGQECKVRHQMEVFWSM